MTKPERVAIEVVPELTVVRRGWIIVDQPELECELVDGSYIKIAWDTDYNHRLLYVAADKSADYISATADQTGLPEDVLAPLVDEVESAVRHHIAEERSEYMGDAMSFEDGR